MEKFRSKCFNLVLYADDDTHVNALTKITTLYDYAYILHDKDTDSDGNLKKPHYHIVLRFKNAKWNTALASELDITPNYIQQSMSLKRSLLYLIHYYDEDKFNYDPQEVIGTMKQLLMELIQNGNKTESQKINDIFDLIDSYSTRIDFIYFVRNIASMGYWDVFRRSFGIINKYIECHNSKIYEELENISKSRL